MHAGTLFRFGTDTEDPPRTGNANRRKYRAAYLSLPVDLKCYERCRNETSYCRILKKFTIGRLPSSLAGMVAAVIHFL